MGQRVAAPGVTVVDDGTIPTAAARSPSTTRARRPARTTLIEDGILVGYMQDRQNARLMGVPPTGNGRRQCYAHIPMPRMTNTYHALRAGRPGEILASVKNGIYAVAFGGGQVDITSGKFVFSCTEAYQIEDGKIGPAGQGRHADRQRPGRADPGQDDRQRHDARPRHRHLRQARPGRAGRRRPADAPDRPAHRRRHRDLRGDRGGMADAGAGPTSSSDRAARRRRGRRAALQAARPRLGARLPRRRPRHRAVRLGLFTDPQSILHVAELGVVHAPVHHRPRDAAVAAVGDAPRDLRARRGAGAGLRRAAHRRRRCSLGYPPAVAFDRRRWASSSPPPPSSCRCWRSAARRNEPHGPADHLDPAARGPGDRAAAGARRLPRARRRAATVGDSRWLAIGIALAAIAGAGRGRPLAAQPAVPHPRRRPRRAR